MHKIIYKLSDEERSTLDENLGEDPSKVMLKMNYFQIMM